MGTQVIYKGLKDIWSKSLRYNHNFSTFSLMINHYQPNQRMTAEEKLNHSGEGRGVQNQNPSEDAFDICFMPTWRHRTLPWKFECSWWHILDVTCHDIIRSAYKFHWHSHHYQKIKKKFAELIIHFHSFRVKRIWLKGRANRMKNEKRYR